MATVLLTHTYFLRFDPKQWATGQPYAPLGTLYAAAVMREAGHKVIFADSMFAEGPEHIQSYLDEYQPDYVVLYDDGFNYLTKMCLTNMREAGFAMIRSAKEHGATVIVSGSDATDQKEKYLATGADYIIIGEGEQTLFELLEADPRNMGTTETVAGLAYLKDAKVFRTTARPVMKDLDEIPFPAWDMIDLDPYRKMWMEHAGYFSMNMATTRGCPFKCNWCAKPIYGNRYNSRTPEHVVEELVLLKKYHQFDHIWFCDDIFGLKPGWVKAFADLTVAAGLQFRFKIQARADLLLEEDMIRDLARAGCDVVWMGAESGSQRILDAMDKGTKVEQIFQATRNLKLAGIRPAFFIQFGYPGETKEDIRRTIRMICDLLPDEMGISVSYPLPGTVFHERVKDELKQKSNWTDSDDLALMFRNTYSPAYYRQLHRYVHRKHRLHMALSAARKLASQPLVAFGQRLRKACSAFYYAPAAWMDHFKLKRLSQPQL